MSIKTRDLVELINKKKGLKLKPNDINAIVSKLKIADITKVKDEEVKNVTKLVVKASKSKAPTIKHMVTAVASDDVFKRKCPKCKGSMDEVRLINRDVDYCSDDRIVLPRKIQEN